MDDEHCHGMVEANKGLHIKCYTRGEEGEEWKNGMKERKKVPHMRMFKKKGGDVKCRQKGKVHW